MNQDKKDWSKGSFTIEASIIIPIIIMITVMILYISFFLYNRCIISQKCYIIAFRGSMYEDGFTDPVLDRFGFIEREKEALFGNKLIAIKSFHTKSDIQDKSIVVLTEAYIKVPFSLLLKRQGFYTGWIIKEQKKANIIKEIDFIRNCRKLEKIITR